MDIWQFQRRLTGVLLGWAAASMVSGLFMARGGDPFRRGLGEQFAGWGAVNAAIALVGRRGARRQQHAPDANAAEKAAAEKHKLSRLLWVNTGLDVFYVAGGMLAMSRRGADDARWRGRGLGIVIQGSFLFLFDLVNARLLEGGEEE